MRLGLPLVNAYGVPEHQEAVITVEAVDLDDVVLERRVVALERCCGMSSSTHRRPRGWMRRPSVSITVGARSRRKWRGTVARPPLPKKHRATKGTSLCREALCRTRTGRPLPYRGRSWGRGYRQAEPVSFSTAEHCTYAHRRHATRAHALEQPPERSPPGPMSMSAKPLERPESDLTQRPAALESVAQTRFPA